MEKPFASGPVHQAAAGQERVKRWQQATRISEEPLWWRSLLPISFLILALWNWRLAGAIAIGSFTMNAIFAFQTPAWQQRWQQWQHRLQGQNLIVTIAVAGGSLAMLGSYIAFSLWQLAGDRWLGIALVTQGVVTVSIAVLLLWQVWHRSQPDREQFSFQELLQGCVDPSPVKRLLAAHHLQLQLHNGTLSGQQQQLAVDCLQLAIADETEALVREALLAALQVA